MGLIKSFKNEVINFVRMITPSKTNKFFEELDPESSRHMVGYLLAFGVPLFIGYFMNLYYKAGFDSESTCQINSAIESAFVTYLVLVFLPIAAGAIISLFGKGLTGREVEPEEIISIIAYPLSVVLLTGLFRAHILTIVLHYLGIGYGLYLLYVAINARFGFDKSLIIFIFFLVVSSFLLMVMFWIGLSIINLIAKALNWFGIPRNEAPIRIIPPWCY